MGSGGGDELSVGVAARPVLGVLSALERLVDELDPAQAPARDAVDLVRVFDRLGRVADVAKALAAGRVAESSLWRRSGHRSAAHWMARECGIGVGDAVKLLETAEVAAQAPLTREALTSGALSPRQARAVGRAEQADPAEGARLVEAARTLPVNDLETAADRAVAAASNESEAVRAERIRRARHLHTGTNPDGSGWGRWQLPPLEHAALLAAIEANRSDVFTEKRRSGEREPAHAYAADALARLARRAPTSGAAGRCGTGPADPADTADTADGVVHGAAGGGGAGGEGVDGGTGVDGAVSDDFSFAKVIVRVDLTALDRGTPAPGEVCEIAGQGPIPVADAWRMIDGDAFVAAVATRGTELARLVHLGRRPNALQRTGLDWLHGGACAVDGCTSSARLEIDHVEPWADTEVTDLRQLAPLCGHHHDLKTHHRHRLGPLLANGRRRLLAPDEQDRPPPSAAPPPPRSITAHPGTVGTPRPDQGHLFDTG